MSSTLKQRISHSLTVKQGQHDREYNANLIEKFREQFEQACKVIFKGKHNIEYYPSSIVASTNKRQLALRADENEVFLEKQLFVASGCKSFITKGATEVTAKLQALIDKEQK